MLDITSYANGYSPVGDVLTVTVVIVLAVLIHSAYVKQSNEFRMYKAILLCTLIAAVSNVFFRTNIGRVEEFSHYILYFLRYTTHFSVFSTLALYILYIKSQMKLAEGIGRRFDYVTIGLFLIFAAVDLLGMVFKFGFCIYDNENIQPGHFISGTGYVVFALIILYILVRYGKNIYRPVVIALYATLCISLIVVYIEIRYSQKSYAIATLIFPAISVMYLMHSNPYDLQTGSLNADSFEENLNNSLKKNDNLLIFCLHLLDVDRKDQKYPKGIRDKVREVSTYAFRGAKLFLVSRGKMILTARLALNSDYENKIERILETFHQQYAIYKQDYKLIILRTDSLIDNGEDYVKLLEYTENRMLKNEIHFVTDEDVEKYKSHRYIIDQLADINNRRDLRDPRVLVYCQPVYNLETGKFDTAEALMRLRLDNIGMVFPDRFIPIAEKYNYMHMLSLIILSKTCNEIRHLLDEGYVINRISVNFSMLDIRERDFCENVNKIVQDSKIPFDKVAIEITESQNENDFIDLKNKLMELRESGITFYLDDFGTGYSNMERIMELPFDIIKFDRSLVIASGADNKSKTMVTHMAHMFKDMNYSVLYEGVEDEQDQNRCKGMYARYLQGYKYSKPIPIEQLSVFLEREKKA
ncbi:MAG: EAL domain-containing protein [Butyrivibrio sp.]|nr:EAL domain-containing protein [Butyrivibrio sp.]